MNIRGATGDYESNPNFAGRSAALRAAAKFWGTMAQVQGNVSTLTVTSSKHMHMALQALLSAGRQSFMDDPYRRTAPHLFLLHQIIQSADVTFHLPSDHIEKIRQASHAKENETQVLVETPHVRDMILRMLISRSDDAFFGIEADITEHALKVTMAAFRGMETTLTDASECNADNFLQKSFNMIRKARISSSSETSVLHSIGSPSIGIKEVAIDMGDRRRSSLMEIYHEEVDGILKPETLLRREVQDDIDRLQRASHSRSEINKLGIQETARFQPAYHSTTTPKIDTKSPSPNDKIGTTSSSVTPVTDGGDKRAAALLYKTLNGLVNTIYKDTVIPEVLKNLRKDLESVIKSKGAAPVSRKDTERVTENNFPMDKRLIATAPETLSPDNPITQPLEPNLRDPPSLRRVGNLKLRPKPLEDLSVARYAGDKTAIQGANAGTPSPSTPHLASYLASVCNSNPTGDETPSEVYRVQTPTDSNLPIPRPSSLMNSNRSGHQVKPSPHCHTPVTMGPSFHHYHGQLMDRSATQYVHKSFSLHYHHYRLPKKRDHFCLAIVP